MTYASPVKEKEIVIPYIYDLQNASGPNEVIEWYKGQEEEISEHLLTHGAILLKNTGVDTVDNFHIFSESTFPKFRSYVDGNYPRRQLKGHVYISTEYDAKFDITLHNELSYSQNWPSKLLFCCCIPPEVGGETPLVDSRAICRALPQDLLEEFESKQLKYIRNLHGGDGMGASWQITFETENKEEVEKACKNLDIEFYWKPDGGIKLISKRPATRIHPITGEKVWFNQVDQYHPSHFPEEVYETLMMVNDGDESELPMYVTFGDDSKVTEEIIKEVTATIDDLMIVRKWKKSDIVIVENMLVAHGRKSYQGDRKIIVSMTV